MTTKTDEVTQNVQADYFKALVQHLSRIRTKPKDMDYRLKWHRSDIVTEKLLNEMLADIDILLPLNPGKFSESRHTEMLEHSKKMLIVQPYLTVDELYVYLTGVYHGFAVGWNEATDIYVQWVPAKRGK
jgi:hypothetical protein